MNIASYLTSDTTISPYIVPDIKEEIFFYKNPVSKLFCSLGSANRVFGGLSSRTNNCCLAFFLCVFFSVELVKVIHNCMGAKSCGPVYVFLS